MKQFTIAIGSDHAGFKYKEAIKAWLLDEGHTVRDFGTDSETPCDYPDFVRGIVIGGSGNGEAIVANREKGIRCAVCWSEQTAFWSRSHNDSNCISIGERTVSQEQAIEFVRIWLVTGFEGGRHIERLRKIDGV